MGAIIKKFGIEPRPFTPKANTLPIKLHLEDDCPKQELNLADFSFQENALTS